MDVRKSLDLSNSLAGTKLSLLFVGALSSLVNILYLTGSLFMLQVYDRVIPSRSVPTLVALALLAGMLYLFQAALDVIRSRILVRVGLMFDAALSPPVFDAVMRQPLLDAGRAGDGLQPLRDIAAVRGFLAGGGPVILFDLPWLPFFIGICFLFHPLIGLVASLGALALLLLAGLSELMSRRPVASATALMSRRLAIAEVGRRNAESLAAMGMGTRFRERWLAVNGAEAVALARSSDIGGGFGALSKALRYLLQSAMLAVGALLVIEQQATGGIIIASSILSARALAPVELAIGQWKGFLAARQSWARLKALLGAVPADEKRLVLPAPAASLAVEDLTVAVPGQRRILVGGVRFSLRSGSALGIIGPSASGKSTLARALAGVWAAAGGVIRLDGAPIDQWDRERLGAHIGYLPQDVELFAGTVAENIARMSPGFEDAVVIQAARAAGVHEMILGLENGYNAQVGDQGVGLSKGQRQRIALARALYGEPFLVILDEPNANLDQEGEAALAAAVLGVRARGGIAIVVAHRPNVIATVDHVLMMQNGRMGAFGPKNEVLDRVLARPAPLTPLKVVGEEGGH